MNKLRNGFVIKALAHLSVITIQYQLLHDIVITETTTENDNALSIPIDIAL